MSNHTCPDRPLPKGNHKGGGAAEKLKILTNLSPPWVLFCFAPGEVPEGAGHVWPPKITSTGAVRKEASDHNKRSQTGKNSTTTEAKGPHTADPQTARESSRRARQRHDDSDKTRRPKADNNDTGKRQRRHQQPRRQQQSKPSEKQPQRRMTQPKTNATTTSTAATPPPMATTNDDNDGKQTTAPKRRSAARTGRRPRNPQRPP